MVHGMGARMRGVLLALALAGGGAQAQAPGQAPAQGAAQQSERQRAPGFTQRAADSRLVVVPADMELFSISAGGVQEPRADWTEAAQRHFRAALVGQAKLLGTQAAALREDDMDDLAQVNALHGAVADAVFLHHAPGFLKLPTKDGKLDWSMGDAVLPLREKTGADYALFFWVRDSYASSERKAAMVAMALLGVGLTGGSQVAYASLVDLKDGRVVWFNHLQRVSGDLREAEPARETVEALLKGFPPAP
ncbi:hypothetical protein PE066_01280 [Ramlibacter tataouinensis]|uniref:hypothetical protein n=1 Tax=Ramlibacter tataouinensis TaxID=94132 RepID=UPI0022F3B8D2|nr:hypothetical protein [Ramlibacter tataouinensis]WBY02194.1 hypothetical protein PE066_01280 [Ramlibacter tataouinensis]